MVRRSPINEDSNGEFHCHAFLSRNIAMSKVVAIMSMSLDGYVADRDDGVAEVFDWYFNSGDVEIDTGGSDPMTFRMSEPSAEHVRSLTSELGAVLTGRRTFAHGWGGNHAWGPAFVLTHQVPAGWPRPDSTVHFVRLAGMPAVPGNPRVIAGVGVTHLRYPVRMA
jgi:hypothetical protein